MGDLCDDNEKKNIKKYQKWDVDELEMQIEEGDEKIKKIRDAAGKVVQKMEGEVSGIEKRIQKEEKKRDDKIAKESKILGIKHMKAIKVARGKSEEKKEEL